MTGNDNKQSKTNIMKKQLKERLIVVLKTDANKFNRYVRFCVSFKWYFKVDLTFANLSDANLIDADLSGANLSGANLRRANLSDADLSGANLSDANLSCANLSDADLIGANLSGANLSDANLRRANLSDADLSSANLSDANLSGANLRRADLSGANLSDANLSDANLSGANLRRADLSGAEYNESTAFLLPQCPSEGSFIAWKKASGLIIKIVIPEYAKRSSATTLKCRCSHAIVLDIQELNGEKSLKTKVSSDYDSSFEYEVGKIVEVDNFDEDRFNECSTGIHFFISREMAVKYN